MKRAPLLLTAALALSATLGCGPQFDLSSELESLRVLTVKKDKPYAQPGETVKMQLLWHDAKGPRPVQRLFIGGCFNPPADLYYSCFPQLAELAAEGTLPLSPGDTFEATLPSDGDVTTPFRDVAKLLPCVEFADSSVMKTGQNLRMG